MARIKLIVTGDMEKAALHLSLRRFFPDRRDGEDVIWDKPRYVPCATSYRLRAGAPPSSQMRALARAMIAEAGIGKTGEPADLVVVIDDVELGNVGQEEVIAQHFKGALTSILETHDLRTRERYREILRNRCSFHLLKPMVESYLFADEVALRTAGVPAGINPRLVHPTDVEQFETNDPKWLPICALENAKPRPSAPWWCHERHPKRYLEHLAPEYDETRHGRDALKGLNWTGVPKCPQDVPVVRALFEDLADWFGNGNALGAGSPHPAFYPTRAVNRAGLLLRNL